MTLTSVISYARLCPGVGAGIRCDASTIRALCWSTHCTCVLDVYLCTGCVLVCWMWAADRIAAQCPSPWAGRGLCCTRWRYFWKEQSLPHQSDQIQLHRMSVCWHQCIDATDGIDPAPQAGSSQPFWSDLYQRLDSLFLLLCPLGFALLCCSFPLRTLPPRAGLHSSAPHRLWGGRDPEAASEPPAGSRDPCAGAGGRQCAGSLLLLRLRFRALRQTSGAAHMALWRGKKQAVTNQDYTAIKWKTGRMPYVREGNNSHEVPEVCTEKYGYNILQCFYTPRHCTYFH